MNIYRERKTVKKRSIKKARQGEGGFMCSGREKSGVGK